MGVNDDFWDDLLSHIRDQVLVPVVGPDLTVVNVATANNRLLRSSANAWPNAIA